MNSIFLQLLLVPFSILLFFTELYYQPNRVLIGSPLEPVRTTERWEKRAPFPSFRYEHATTAVGDDIYAIGGIVLPSVWFPTGLSEVYNAKTDTWRRIADYPVSVHHSGAVTVDGNVYVVGGNGVRIAVRSDVYMYDPVEDTWHKKADLPVARGALGVAALDGRIYAVGGGINKEAINLLHIYDPEKDIWREGKSMPTAREHVTAVSAAGKVFALGGYKGARFNNLKTNEAYDPVTDTWETLAPMPYAESGFTGVSLGDSIFIFGGQQGWAVSNQVHEYKISEDRWIRRSDLPVGRYALTSAVVGGNVHIIGGNTYIMGNVPSQDHDVFTP